MITVTAVVALAAKAAVAVVLLSSGTAKLLGPPSATERGLPRILAWLDRRAGRLALGSTELLVGATSLLALASPVVDSAALVLCGAFFVGSAVLGATSPGTACQCFGAASSSAFGPRHTLLTGILALGATVAFVVSLDAAGSVAWSWHPLMLATLVGVLLLAGRVRRPVDPAERRPA